jgi:prepilin-type N-terminal cleavage/methylation domain-containing protein
VTSSRKFEQNGFTLIELMLVIVIILILSGGSITAYLNFNKTQTVDNDARNLTAEIYRVRTLAASMQYPTGCSSLRGYNLTGADVSGKLTGVVVVADCDPLDVTFPVTKILTGSTLSSFTLNFTPGSGYLGSGSDSVITITYDGDTTVTKTITVGSYGTVTGP